MVELKKDYCQCRLSVEHILVCNNNIVGMIGTNKVDHFIRHRTLYCPIKEHRQQKSEKL